jgi:hypothetical protein
MKLIFGLSDTISEIHRSQAALSRGRNRESDGC